MPLLWYPPPTPHPPGAIHAAEGELEAQTKYRQPFYFILFIFLIFLFINFLFHDYFLISSNQRSHYSNFTPLFGLKKEHFLW